MTRSFLAAVLALMPLQALPAGEAPAPEAKSAQPDFAKLVEDLGNPSFAVREAASEALGKAGESAREALQKALQSKDPEILNRSRILLDVLEARRKPPEQPREDAPEEMVRQVEVLLDQLMEGPGGVALGQRGNVKKGFRVQANINGVQIDQDDLARLEALRGRGIEGLGVRASACPEELLAQLRIPGGVLVRDCEGKREGVDLEKHDVIASAAGAVLADPEALEKLLEASAGKPLELTVYRKGERKTVTLAPPKP